MIRLEIRSPRGELNIDAAGSRESYNFRSVPAQGRHQADQADQAWLEGLARRAREGDRMARIDIRSDAIAEIAVPALDDPQPEIYLKMIDRPAVTYTARPVEITAYEEATGSNVDLSA